jgi:hypothetical protein
MIFWRLSAVFCEWGVSDYLGDDEGRWLEKKKLAIAGDYILNRAKPCFASSAAGKPE